jgi:hypothetical protein
VEGEAGRLGEYLGHTHSSYAEGEVDSRAGGKIESIEIPFFNLTKSTFSIMNFILGSRSTHN